MPREAAQSGSQPFRGERLQLVREFLGLTQKELSLALGTSAAAVSDFENGKRLPSDEFLSRLQSETGFLQHFFLTRVNDPFLEVECSFRHRRTTSQKDKDRVRAHAALIGMVIGVLRDYVRFPTVQVPTLSGQLQADFEQAAQQCRATWKLDLNAPIKQVGRVLEHAGIVVISGSVDVAKIDAFSRNSDNPLIFLNRTVGTFPSRWNFDLAHELGHLVLHRDMGTGSQETEIAADAFASSFLLPAEAFIREFTNKRFSWSLVFELKRRWQVSAAAIIRRGYDLDLINSVQYRRAFQYMSAKRWRVRGEPFEPKFQEPELFEDALSAVRLNYHPSLANFGEILGMSLRVFEEVTLSLRELTSLLYRTVIAD